MDSNGPPIFTDYRASWFDRANCRDADTWVFFGSRDYNNDEPNAQRREAGRKARLAMAREYCDGCGVREECLEWALLYLPHGFAGGMTERERKRESKRRSAADRDTAA